MATQQSNKGCLFFGFLILIMGAGGYFIWDGKKNVIPKDSTNTSISKKEEPKLNFSFTNDEICNLLNMNINKRGEVMYQSGYNQNIHNYREFEYNFNVYKEEYDTRGWFKFYKDKDFYNMFFISKSNYEVFLNQFRGFEKNMIIPECDIVYGLNDQCFVCGMGFINDLKGYLVKVLKSPIEPSPKKDAPKPVEKRNRLGSTI